MAYIFSTSKNTIRVDLMDKYVEGNKVLDARISSCKASIMLLKKGKNILRIESSQAMLDKCRVQSGNYPIMLIVGDLSKLPIGN